MLQLLVRHGWSYERVARTLHSSPERVRQQAHAAVLQLVGPVPQVDEALSERLTDHVLAQPPPGGTEAHEQLPPLPPSAGAWLDSARAALARLGEHDPRPLAPAAAVSGSGTRQNGVVGAAGGRPAAALRSGRAERRRLWWPAALLVALLCLAGAVALAVGRGTPPKPPPGAVTAPRVERQVVLRPVARGADGGVAVVTSRGGRRALLVQARLRGAGSGGAYELWLYNSPADARSVGSARAGRRGDLRRAVELPGDAARFRFIDVSLEPADGERGHSGRSVLRGTLGG